MVSWKEQRQTKVSTGLHRKGRFYSVISSSPVLFSGESGRSPQVTVQRVEADIMKQDDLGDELEKADHGIRGYPEEHRQDKLRMISETKEKPL